MFFIFFCLSLYFNGPFFTLVMFAHHQLQEGACLFPHMQICHISFILQTMSMVLSMLLLLKNILDPSTSTTGGQQKRPKKKKSAQKSNAGSAEIEQNEVDFGFIAFFTSVTPNSCL